ncbi:hypothetical protein [Pseudomonas rubra]|uniref:Uncharacterized protein n=1 Tax=Pseudomonas rubra TaxID=2942627 RepID=A0ABT5P8U5_9PSED|nr:hypothetical protein [Pseudomonas rubra]MDD1014650.1 hypothetical protein [Pseudomonas rubra]MDD1041381.1 hypothetical protein [Pseudomonas rubra]MDD1155794.1 hypothetical protein [Pseudomonas rubra]
MNLAAQLSVPVINDDVVKGYDMSVFNVFSPQGNPSMSILADEFALRLCAFNELTRDMRDAGIAVERLEFADNKIFINPLSVELMSRRFGHELLGVCYATVGRRTRNSVTIREVDVVWFSRVKEQEQ